MNWIGATLITLAPITALGCTSTLPTGNDAGKQTLTAGVVQREIRAGMSGGEVATILGSPNIVTSGQGGTEVWVYDRTFTQVESAGSSTRIWFLVGATSGESDIERSSQSTLTVVIKFAADKTVSDVAFHQSKF